MPMPRVANGTLPARFERIRKKKGFLPEGDVAMWFGSLPVGSFTTFK